MPLHLRREIGGEGQGAGSGRKSFTRVNLQTDSHFGKGHIVEGELAVIRHPARGEFPAVVELQVREARR